MSGALLTLVCGLAISGGLIGIIRSARPRSRGLGQMLDAVDGNLAQTPSPSRSVADSVDFLGYRSDRPADLFLLGIDPGEHATRKVLTAVAGGAWLFLVLAILSVGGLGIALWLPIAGGLLGAVVGFIYPDLDTKSSAEDARVEFDYAVAAFLGLARTLTTGGQEANAALAAAADAGSGPWFRHLQRACGQARVENREVAETLAELGQRANIRVLEQVAGVLRTAYKAGTPPSEALATRTQMVLREQFHDMRIRAAERTEMMSVPTAAISLLFIVYIGLPAFVGLTSGTVMF